MDRSRNYAASQAIQQYLDANTRQVWRIQEGLADARAGRVSPADDVLAEIAVRHGWQRRRESRSRQPRSGTSTQSSTIDYIALENPAAAEKVRRAIGAVARQLAEFTEMGPAGRLPETRGLPVADLPYLIVCPIAGNHVTATAVFHGARGLVRALAERRTAAST